MHAADGAAHDPNPRTEPPPTAETTTENRSRTQPVTYVCRACTKAKRDGAVRQIVFRVDSEITTTYGLTGIRRTVRRTWLKEGGSPLGFYVSPDGVPGRTCDCGFPCDPRPVRGVYSADHKCGARCTNAKGGDCECHLDESCPLLPCRSRRVGLTAQRARYTIHGEARRECVGPSVPSGKESV